VLKPQLYPPADPGAEAHPEHVRRRHVRPGPEARLFLSTIALVAILVVTVAVQLRSNHYNPFYYWTVILTTTMAGATISDS
jgi:hypothetical protein